MLFAALILRTDRRIVRQLRQAEAISTDTAIPLGTSNILAGWRLNRLARAGAICQAQPEHYYLEEAGYVAFRKRRRIRVAVVICILIPLILMIWGWLNLE